MIHDDKEQITLENSKTKKYNLNEKNTVDINILLNRVRASERKKKFNTIIFFSLLSFVVFSLGLITTL